MAKRKNRILSLVFFFFFWLPFLSFFLFLNSVDVCVRVCVCLFEREQNIKQNYTGCILQPTVYASSYIAKLISGHIINKKQNVFLQRHLLALNVHHPNNIPFVVADFNSPLGPAADDIYSTSYLTDFLSIHFWPTPFLLLLRLTNTQTDLLLIRTLSSFSLSQIPSLLCPVILLFFV